MLWIELSLQIHHVVKRKTSLFLGGWRKRLQFYHQLAVWMLLHSVYPFLKGGQWVPRGKIKRKLKNSKSQTSQDISCVARKSKMHQWDRQNPKNEMKKSLMTQEESFNDKNLSQRFNVPCCYDLHKFFYSTWTNLGDIVVYHINQKLAKYDGPELKSPHTRWPQNKMGDLRKAEFKTSQGY